MRYVVGMIHTDYAIARIRAYIEMAGVRKSRLAAIAEVPEGCIRKINSKEWNPTTDTLRKLESVIPKDFIFEFKKFPTKKPKRSN